MSLLRGNILGAIYLKKALKDTKGILYTDQGKIDLRGLSFPEPSEVGEWRSLTIAKNAFGVLGNRFENVDFSYCNLNYAWIERTSIRSCLFEGADLSNTKIEGGEITETTFTRSKFKDALFRPIGKDDGLLKNVSFIGCDFAKAFFSNIRVENCLFEDCKFSETFWDARLSNSQFSGEIQNAIFRGHYSFLKQSLLDRIFDPRPNPKTWNKMVNVDFSKAHFGEVMFNEGVDLSSTIFPAQDDYFKVTNLTKVCQRAREIVAADWGPPYQEMALRLIDKLFLGDRKKGMEIDFLPTDLYIPDLPEDFGRRLLGLLKEVNAELLSGRER